MRALRPSHTSLVSPPDILMEPLYLASRPLFRPGAWKLFDVIPA
jgi:hypothetical protein